MKCLVIHSHPQSIAALNRAIDAAKQISETVDALVIGDIDTLDNLGVDTIYHYPNAIYPTPQDISTIIGKHLSAYTHIISHSDTTSKDFLPYFCGQNNLPMLSEIRTILSPSQFERGIYASDAIEVIESKQPTIVLTIKGIYFNETHSGQPSIEKQDFHFEGRYPKILKEPKKDINNIDLMTAEIVVSGGRGFGSKEAFDKLHELAKHFHAGVGASRAAVDAGYIGNEHQVGQTGKQIAPRLYFALGISGAVQHLSGMKDSQTIIAVDKDPDAPIFKIAQYGYCGDLFPVIETLLTKQLRS